MEFVFKCYIKGLGELRKVDEAFQLLESVEKGTAPGSPKLSAPLIYGLLNAIIDTGESEGLPTFIIQLVYCNWEWK